MKLLAKTILLVILSAPSLFAKTNLGASGSAPVALQILKVAHFQLKSPMTYNWENEKPLVTTGSLLKVKMPSEFVLPRETAENIFYVDGRIAARAKVIDDQTLVLIVPQEIRSKNSILMIGEPGLPETISTSQRESFFQMGINGTASVPKISISPNNIVELQLENEEELYSQQF